MTHPIKMILLLLLLAACSGQAQSITSTPQPSPTPSGPPPLQERVKFIPKGFEISSYGILSVGGGTSLTFGPDGDLYVLSVSGQIFKLRDTNDDHIADSVDVVYQNEAGVLNYAVGMTFGPDGTLYVSDKGRIVRMLDIVPDGIYDAIDPVIVNLPALLYPFHSNNGIAFGPDGKIYVGIGSTSDHGPLKVKWEASILRMNPDGSDVEVFATGFRNPFDLAFSPNGDLFTADNSPDQLNRTLRYVPPEELNHVRQGRDYGFPNVYGKMLPPGNTTEPPITEFFSSSVNAGLMYYSATQFPAHYRNGIFVAEYGTAVPAIRERRIDEGHAVVFVPLQPTDDGTYTGDFESFVLFTPHWERPVDVTVGPDGALYILDNPTTEIFRVSYTG
jgi:glucose/arabinose dehydrogenase